MLIRSEASDASADRANNLFSEQRAASLTRHSPADRQRHELANSRVAEPAMVGQRPTAQQLGQHCECLVGEVLIDERFLSGERLGRTARRLFMLLAFRGHDWVEFGNRRQTMLLLSVR